MEMIHGNALRLQKLVNTLLEFTRIEAGRVRAVYEPVDLSALTAELASVFRSAIDRAGMRLIVDCQPLAEPVYVDRDMWERIVLNLMSNAFKFTLEGEIGVSLGHAGGHAVLRIRDTGTGISREQLPHIFKRFHRVEGVRARTHEGTGIGLASSRSWSSFTAARSRWKALSAPARHSRCGSRQENATWRHRRLRHGLGGGALVGWIARE